MRVMGPQFGLHGLCPRDAAPRNASSPSIHPSIHFLEVLREVGGGGQKMSPPFFGLKIMNLLGFFDFEPK